MPVDRFGKLFFPKPPANRYATPMNRKPKRTNKDYLWLVGALVLLLFLAGLASLSLTHTTQKSDWYQSFVHDGADSTELGPVEVSGTWRFTWACPVTNKAMSLYVKDEQGTILYFDNIECTSDDHAGFIPISYTGQVFIEMSAIGNWTVSIEEPTQ